MIEAGALDELRALQPPACAPDLPLLKAVGVRELLAHLEGRLELAERARARHDPDAPLRQAPDHLAAPPAARAGARGGFGDAPEIMAEPALAAIGRLVDRRALPHTVPFDRRSGRDFAKNKNLQPQ